MENLAREIFGRYGLAAILFIVVAAGALWVLAHQLSAPGERVSVLWGLVEYTKDETNESSVKSVAGPSLQGQGEEGGAQGPAVTSLVRQGDGGAPNLVAHVQSDADALKAARSLRLEKQLRELGPLESGKNMASMSLGTYGFLYASYLQYIPAFEKDPAKEDRFKIASLNSLRPHSFEVQRSKSGIYSLLAYASASDASRITGSRDHAIDITISPMTWESFDEFVDIPFGCIESAKDREIQRESGEYLTIVDIRIGACSPSNHSLKADVADAPRP